MWELSREDARLTCQMLTSKLQDSQLRPDRQSLMKVCQQAGVDSSRFLGPTIQLKKL